MQLQPIDWDSLVAPPADEPRAYQPAGDLQSIIVELANQIAGPETDSNPVVHVTASATIETTRPTPPAAPGAAAARSSSPHRCAGGTGLARRRRARSRATRPITHHRACHRTGSWTVTGARRRSGTGAQARSAAHAQRLVAAAAAAAVPGSHVTRCRQRRRTRRIVGRSRRSGSRCSRCRTPARSGRGGHAACRRSGRGERSRISGSTDDRTGVRARRRRGRAGSSVGRRRPRRRSRNISNR